MKPTQTQLHLPISGFSTESIEKAAKCETNERAANRLSPCDRAFHDWYRFVLSFPPHLVSTYIEDFGLDERHLILDPFCGTGTTIVESKLHGIQAIGLEANIFAHFASSVKVDWDIDPDLLKKGARHIANSTLRLLKTQGIDDRSLLKGLSKKVPLMTLHPEATGLLLSDSISPLPLHKTLTLLDSLKEHKEQTYYRHALLALANALVFRISNLHFGPEVGVGKPKIDVPVVASWFCEAEKIANDLQLVKGRSFPGAKVYLGDARNVSGVIEPNSVDAVITSPPYPNEKDYTRTTRLESVVLGFIKSKAELKDMKKNFIR